MIIQAIPSKDSKTVCWSYRSHLDLPQERSQEEDPEEGNRMQIDSECFGQNTETFILPLVPIFCVISSKRASLWASLSPG